MFKSIIPKSATSSTGYWILSQLLFIGLCVLLMTVRVSAKESPVTLVLFKGDVHLLDKDKQKHTAYIGQEFSLNDYPWIQTSSSSRTYLQTGNRLVELKSSGIYKLQDLFANRFSLIDNTLSFLRNLAKPRGYVSQSRVRGNIDDLSPQNQEAVFNDFWEEVVLEENPGSGSLKTEDMLAAAAWFQQRNRPARVAYILERLNSYPGIDSDFYRQLRNDSLKAVTLADISSEVEATRKASKIKLDPGCYKALLIGIDNYQDENWQTLKTPLRDVNELKQLLEEEYLFKSEDILLLENATYADIIGAFNQIKRSTNEETNLLIYYAGHGYYPPDEDEGYWIPSDGGDPSSQRLFIPTSTILSKIKSINTRHTLVIADSCFSGSLIRRTRGVQVHSRYFMDLSQRKSRQIITSGGLEPVSDKGWGDNSVFAGKLIDILSKDRNEPLSASELALNLRKEVKNAKAIQTPEYGRLYVQDDDSGEFFFIRKDQELRTFAQAQQRARPTRNFQVPEDYEEEPEPEPVLHEGHRLKLGFGFHLASLAYKFDYKDGGSDKTESGMTSLTGALMFAGYKRTIERISYEGLITLGQISNANIDCEDPDTNSEFCKVYEHSSVSGQFFSLSAFQTYAVYTGTDVNLDLGGGIAYNKYNFKKIFGAEDKTTAFISACGRFEIVYVRGNFQIGEKNNLCFRTFETEDSLNDYTSGDLNDLHIPLTFDINLVATYRF